MRNIHRWVSTIGMLLFAYLVISGTVLAFEEILGPRNFETYTVTPTLPKDAIERFAATTARAALNAANSDAPLKAIRIQVRLNGKQPQGTATLIGSDTQTLLFNAETAQALPAPTPVRRLEGGRAGPRSLNATLQTLHSGEIVGVGGQWLIIATGTALALLSVTGIWMYFQMLNLRWKRSKKSWFWR